MQYTLLQETNGSFFKFSDITLQLQDCGLDPYYIPTTLNLKKLRSKATWKQQKGDKPCALYQKASAFNVTVKFELNYFKLFFYDLFFFLIVQTVIFGHHLLCVEECDKKVGIKVKSIII